MKKNGFTLIELLAVIVILSIIILIAVPAINGISKMVKEKQRNNLIKSIEKSASDYAFDNKLSTNSKVNVKTLIDNGYLDSDEKDNNIIYDPTDKSSMNCYEVTVTKSGSYYNAKITKEQLCS